MSAASFARFKARCEAGAADLPDIRFRPSRSPALNTAIAEMEGHRRRWDSARAKTLAATGCTDAPVRDVRIDLNHAPANRRSPTGALL